MKKLILLGLAIVLFTSCDTKPERYTQQSKEIESYKAGIKDYSDQKWESLVTRYADTANVFFNTAIPMRASKIPEFHQNNEAAFSSRGFVEKGQEYEMAITDEGKTWVNFWGTWKCTLAANNKVLEIPVHLTAQFIDGKVVREYGYWDNAPIVLALQEIEAAKMATEPETK
ncbi:MAG: nuclear transport factor 2 family protein [Lutibacter sp.]|nr:nuclear transport factor 2 family protein [Lutibacter sp.]